MPVVAVETQLAFYGNKSTKRKLKNSYSAEKLYSPDEKYFRYQTELPCKVKKPVLCISVIDRVQSNGATIKLLLNGPIKGEFVFH